MAPHREHLELTAAIRAAHVRIMPPGMSYIAPPFAQPPRTKRQFFTARDVAHCEAQCLAMPPSACRAGTFIQQGADEARCWLSAHVRPRGKGVRCVAPCSSFERKSPLIKRGRAPASDSQRVRHNDRGRVRHAPAAEVHPALTTPDARAVGVLAGDHGMGYWLMRFAHVKAEQEGLGSGASAELYDEAESWSERHGKD